MPAPPQFRALLEVLARHQVDFIVVGGVAGVLQGAPLLTRDLDIVYRLADDNAERLLAALEDLEAKFRADPRQLEPNRSHLASRGHKLLTTRLGDLDCLGTIEDDTDYEDLLPHVDRMQIGETEFQVLALGRLVEVKEKLTRPKDRLALLQLRATLAERGKS